MLVDEILTTEFEQVSRDATLAEAVGRMLERESDYVVLTDAGDPDGVLTERKALVAAYKTGKALSEIPVAGFSTGFPTTVTPDTTVLLAVAHMRESGVEVLPVVEDLELVGVVTRETLLDNMKNLRSEALSVAEQGKEWTR